MIKYSRRETFKLGLAVAASPLYGVLGAAGQPVQSGQTTGQATAWLTEFIARHGVPGLWVGASLRGKPVYIKAFGKKYAGGDTAEVTDVLPVGSLSKYFSSDLAALCVTKGYISWNSRVNDICRAELGINAPECTQATLRQLTNHQGGFPRDHIPWLNDPESATSRSDWRRDQLATFTGLRPNHKLAYVSPTRGQTPGGEIVYSNFGSSVVGTMLELATERPLESLLTEELLKPFGLFTPRLGLSNPSGVDRSLPIGHIRSSKDQAWGPYIKWNENVEPRSMIATLSGGLRMDISDLLSYFSARCTDQAPTSALSSSTMRSLYRADLRSDFATGAIAGYRSWFKADKSRQFVITYVANANLESELADELESYLRTL